MSGFWRRTMSSADHLPSDSTETEIRVVPLPEQRSLREQVTSALRAAVISGEMRPGVVYSAPSLAARFRVSATPVREALLDLVKEGLVVSVRNKGFRVTEVTDRQLDDNQRAARPHRGTDRHSPGAGDYRRAGSRAAATRRRDLCCRGGGRPDSLHRGRPAVPPRAARTQQQRTLGRRRSGATCADAAVRPSPAGE